MRPRHKPLAQQVIVITGASSGIGLATARKAGRAGAQVVLVARGEQALEEAVQEIVAKGGAATYALADVGVRDQIETAAKVAIDTFGRIDTWVSNAGVAIYSDLLVTPRDEHERLILTNYWGAVNCAEIATPILALQGGVLITVGSVASDMGSPVMGAYVAAKHAVKGYIDSLRIELNRDRVPVHVTLIKPSGIGTPLAKHVANHKVGEAKVPPPVYDVELVADRILNAAQRPVREEIVGGAGAAQVMIATHFPTLFTLIAGAVTPLLNDPKTPSTTSDNLFTAGSGGEASDGQPAKRLSLYGVARSHRLAIGVALALLSVAVVRTASPRIRPSAPRPIKRRLRL